MIAFIYILGIQTGESIKCWVCRSDGDPKCADPFDNTSFPIADCRTEKPREHLPGLEPTMCRKVRQKVNGNWRYIQGCPGLESLELVAMNDIVSTVQVPTTSMWNIVLVVQRMAVMPVDESLQYRMRNYRFCWQSHVYFQ